MRKAVFLDKDGTLIDNVPYNVDPGKIKFTDGCEQGLKLLHAEGYELIVISNQPGVAKGNFTINELKTAESAIRNMMRRFGVPLSDFYYCPHHPDGTVPEYAVSCNCRKPAPGLILRAVREHDIDPAQSWFIGDILNDVEAGRRAGCRTILIDNGNETEWILSAERIPHFVVRGMEEAAGIIVCGPGENQ